MKKLLLSAAVFVGLTGAAWADDVLIGLVGPMTGSNAAFGKQMKDGAELAVADINAKGGINGKTIKLVIEDDACDPKQAVAAANKLVSQKVIAVIGHYCSGSSIPGSKIYAEENIVQITPASTNPKLTDERAGPNVYRVCSRDDMQGTVAGAYLADKFKGKKIAILHDKSAYGKGLADETQKAYNKAGAKEAMYEAITAGEKDYSAVVSKMKAAGIDVVYFGGYHPEAGLIVRQMRDQGMKAVMISGDSLVTKEFWQITGDAGEGTLMTFGPDPTKEPAAASVVKAFRDKKIEPEGYVLYTYGALQTYAQAATAAKSFKGADVEKALNTGTFSTVLGSFKYDKKGDPILKNPYVFWAWSKGDYKPL